MAPGGTFVRARQEPVSVYPDSVAHAGWVYKQSKHLKFWRKRWMVLISVFGSDSQGGS